MECEQDAMTTVSVLVVVSDDDRRRHHCSVMERSQASRPAVCCSPYGAHHGHNRSTVITNPIRTSTLLFAKFLQPPYIRETK